MLVGQPKSVRPGSFLDVWVPKMMDLSELAQYNWDLAFFWWSFHRNLVIWILFGDWEGKVFQN